MKSKTLPTKRKAVTKGVFRKLNAVTQGRRRKQRAATTASARDFDDGQAGARVGRALFVILLIHLLAVAMIFVHHRFLSDRPVAESSAPAEDVQVAQVPVPVPAAAPESGVVRSQLSPNETPYIVARGDTYASVAAAHQISEQDLRGFNNNAAMRPGLLLKIPVKRVVIRTPRPDTAAPAPPVAQAQTPAPAAQPIPRPAPAVPARDQGLVPAIDTSRAPRAVPVGAPATSGDKYVVKKGDTVWGIANRHGVSQQKLMDANGISDPRKLRLGMTLKIP